MEIGWVSGKEPAILGWLKKMGKLPDASEKDSRMASPPPVESRGESSAAPSGTGTPSFSFATEDDRPKGSTPFSSFVCLIHVSGSERILIDFVARYESDFTSNGINSAVV